MEENDGDCNGAAESLATSRSRRNRPDKFGRLAALQKLRQLKGGKNKYEVSTVSDVYEEVDEREYIRRRQDKIQDDWIVDDDGSGYVEDGREIFDEDDDDDDIFTSKKSSRSCKKKDDKSSKSKGNIKSMLINMPVKKRKAESDIALEDDELLGDILQDFGAPRNDIGRPSLSKKQRPSHSPIKTYSPINPFAKIKINSPVPANPHHNASNLSSNISSGNLNSHRATVNPFVSKISNSPHSAAKNKATDSPKNYSNSPSSVGMNDDSSSPNVNVDNGKKSTPIISTPVRSISRQPRAVLRENAAVDSPPKARRSLAVTAAAAAAAVRQETEADFADMDFAELDDDDMVEEMIASAEAKEDKKQTAVKDDAEVNTEDKPSNRGFTTRAQNNKSSTSGASGWEDIMTFNNVHNKSSRDTTEVAEQVVIPELSFDTSKLPLINEGGKQILRMFWLDAFEEPYRQPGTVFLFGKVWIESAKIYTSCCVSVRNISRRIFLLPRTKRVNLKTKEVIGDEVTMKDVYDEFNDKVTKRFDIKEFKSRSVKKKYAFEKLEVPNEADYLEVCYSAQHPAMPSDLCGETFSHVFGYSSSSLETFLLDRKIKGPCWLDIEAPQSPKPALSWCKVEAVASKPNQVKISTTGNAPPPVVVLTLTLRTTVNPSTHQSEVAAVGCLVHTKFPLDKPPPNPPFLQHFCVLTKPSNTTWPWDAKKRIPDYKHTKIEKMDSERALLGFLLAKIQQLDPDVIVGHDVLGYDLGILLNRITANKIPNWSRIGRLKRSQVPKQTGRGYAERTALCGRLICDIKLSAKELIRAKSYELASLAVQVLKVQPIGDSDTDTITPQAVRNMYQSSDSLLQLVSLTMQNSFYVVKLLCELNVLPLALQITNIAGNVMSRTLLGGRSERNEFLLLHAFTERNYITPDKEFNNKNKVIVKETEDGETITTTTKGGRKKAAYAGGLVLEPKKGFYDKYILLMDFNSLYPSIIQEYNICFTTIDRQKEGNTSTSEEGVSAISELPEPDQDPGVLPTEIRKLVESRRSVKRLMKAPDLQPEIRMQYDIRQKALKLTANSMYGCLGFSHSRFYASHLAAMITGKGREILLHTRDLVQRLNFDVIYGDTDSLMINTNCTDYDQCFKLGNKIKAEVNKLYKKLELDVDGVYKYMLLLKKKKYAALAMTKLPNGKIVAEPELKGLDIVRRDWSLLASKAGKHVVDQILSDQGPDERINNIHLHLEKLGQEVKEGKIELSELVITKQLTKRPEDYPDKASLPHVQVALRVNKSTAGKKLKQGDTVPYVICEDGTNNSSSQRAYHPDELKSNSSLTIDSNYYLAHQLHPVIARLCDPIEGSDAARIAECLGLDPSNYRASRQYQQHDGQDEDENGAGELPPQERYRGCKSFTFTCPAPDCDTLIVMDAPFRQGVGSHEEVCLQTCPNPKCQQPLYANTAPLCNILTKHIRAHIKHYYNGWLVCEDPGCSNRTKRVPLQFVRGFPVCNLCHKGVLMREYTEAQLYKQLCFYDYIFDFQKACQISKDERGRDENLRRAYSVMRAEVQRYLNISAYSSVNLGLLFSNLKMN
uniref:DNA polymerase n=1 Tax=Hirondellea gigas TaxID=1518452 RepID=A0A6A7FRZ6_9CRUS